MGSTQIGRGDGKGGFWLARRCPKVVTTRRRRALPLLRRLPISRYLTPGCAYESD